jgi:hypothetical protein
VITTEISFFHDGSEVRNVAIALVAAVAAIHFFKKARAEVKTVEADAATVVADAETTVTDVEKEVEKP